MKRVLFLLIMLMTSLALLPAVLAEEEMYALVISDDAGYDTGTVESWLDTNARLLAARS